MENDGLQYKIRLEMSGCQEAKSPRRTRNGNYRNEGLALSRRIPYKIVGTLPKAFDHAEKGRVDAHVMYRLL